MLFATIGSSQQKIYEASNITTLIACLAAAQRTAVTKDIETNKRLIKALHLFGQSRYQTRLSNAFNIAAALSGHTAVDDELTALLPLLAAVTKTNNKPLTALNYDELQHCAKAPKSDPGNAAVIIKIIENILAIKGRQVPIGMTGRRMPRG